MKAKYIQRKPNGEFIGNMKSHVIAEFCDEILTELPPFETIPTGLFLIAVVDNGDFEAAMVVDNKPDYNRVARAQERGDDRPTKFFLVKQEWVRQMLAPKEENNGR
jgi:hypothetical protein